MKVIVPGAAVNHKSNLIDVIMQEMERLLIEIKTELADKGALLPMPPGALDATLTAYRRFLLTYWADPGEREAAIRAFIYKEHSL